VVFVCLHYSAVFGTPFRRNPLSPLGLRFRRSRVGVSARTAALVTAETTSGYESWPPAGSVSSSS